MLIANFDNNVERYSDEELLEEVEAINNLYDEIMVCSDIDQALKDKLQEHARLIREEEKRRDDRGIWFYPLFNSLT